MANFTDFNYQGAPADSDFIVGYKGDGTVEQRTTVNDLLSASLASKGVRFLGNQSVAIGDGNTAGQNSLAIGDSNVAQGLNSLAQGDSNQVTGLWSTAMGGANTVTGDMAFAHGDLNLASGAYSHAEGRENIAEGVASHAEGETSIASGYASHAEGLNNYTGGYITTNGQTYGGAHAEGAYNVVAAPYAHAEGFANKIGALVYADWYADNPPRLGFGFQNTTLSSLNVYGLNNPLLSSSVRLFFTDESFVRTYSALVSSTSAAYYDPFSETTAFTIFLKADETAILPADEFFSPQIVCVPLTAYDGSTSFSNIGVGAHAQGYLNIAAGSYAYAQGTVNTAVGYASHAAGASCSTGSNAVAAVAHGNACVANGRASHAIGTKALAGHDYSYVWNSNPNVPGTYFTSSVSGQYCVNAPGGIALSGAPTSVEGLEVKNGNNIVAEYSGTALKNSIVTPGGLSASTLFGFGNSAGYFFKGLGSGRDNVAASINGIVNYVNSGYTDINGVYNFVCGDLGRVSGISNVLGMESGSVEGVINTVSSPFVITKILSASNTIFVHTAFINNVTSSFFFRPGQFIQIDGIINTQNQSSGTRGNTRFTVLSSDSTARSITVVEPLTAMQDYRDDQPFIDQRYVVGVQGRNTSNSSNVAGAHAEGIGNTVFARAGHVEGEANVATGSNAHAENIGNFASTGSHAEGTENRAGFGIMYFDSYDASTRTFQLFTNQLSTYNTVNVEDLVPRSSILYFVDTPASSSTRRKFTRFTVLSSDPLLNTVTALSAVYPINIDSLGTGVVTRSRQLLQSVASFTHAEGAFNNARGAYSHAEGAFTIAQGVYSHAAGVNATAKQDYTYAWSSNDGITPQSNGRNTQTTRTGQYMVSAHGGVFLPGKVGIGTDSIENALTVVGTISATTITADNIAYTNAGFTNLPTYRTYQTNVAVKNANWPAVSAAQLAETGYHNSNATYAMPGGLIIKGHALDYNNTPRNLPGVGVYGMYLQNVDSFDPGTTFVSDGRAQVTHGMAFRAGINNFTGGSDHNHVTWNGAPSNSTQAWQMTNGGNNGSVYGYTFPYTNRFMVHTFPQYQYNTTITAISGFLDTREANLVSGTDRLSGVKLLVSLDVSTGNYNLLNVGEVIGLTVNPGLVGIVAATYNSQVTQISANAALSSFQFNSYIGNGDNWKPAQRGIQPISLLARANGGNPGVSLITSQVGTDPSTQYVGLTGSYRGINKHMLARFTNAALLTGYKTGAPLTLWIPPFMPSTSPIGTGIISSDKISTFAQGSFPTGVRSGYFDAYVINVNGTDLEFALCNLMDSYSFENRSWPYTATGTAGWLLYGGSQDTVHRPTFGTTGFYFEREAWNVGSVNFLSGGMVKNAVLGTSESYGNYSYGLGFRGVVLGDKSGTFAGDYNTVFGNNSVALGGEGLISLSSASHQAVVGKYNNPNNNALLVVGAGANNANRTNILEVDANKVSISSDLSGSGRFAASNMLLGPNEGGAYFGRIGVRENSWQVVDNTIGATWTQRDSARGWVSVAMSSDGKIQTAVAYEGYIYTSYDYGVSWTQRGILNYWFAVAMSCDGKIQTAVAESGSFIYTSYDYGVTWTQKGIGGSYHGIAMSSDGRIQTAVEATPGYIYTSYDYGMTWTQRDTARDWADVAMSSDGRIQATGVIGGYIYISYDYGATWAPRESERPWYNIAMSSDGKIQTATPLMGYIYTSYDYGVTWTQRENEREWRNIAMSSDGRIQTAVVHNSGYIYTSYDYGATWTQRESARDWWCIAMSSDGKIQTAGVYNESGGGYLYTSYATIYTPGNVQQSGFTIRSNACLSAAGTTQATATPITTDVVGITACANGAGIRLPTTNGGHNILVNNVIAGVNVYVYPPVGGTIRNTGSIAANAPYNFSGSTGAVQFFALSANTYAAY